MNKIIASVKRNNNISNTKPSVDKESSSKNIFSMVNVKNNLLEVDVINKKQQKNVINPNIAPQQNNFKLPKPVEAKLVGQKEGKNYYLGKTLACKTVTLEILKRIFNDYFKTCNNHWRKADSNVLDEEIKSINIQLGIIRHKAEISENFNKKINIITLYKSNSEQNVNTNNVDNPEDFIAVTYFIKNENKKEINILEMFTCEGFEKETFEYVFNYFAKAFENYFFIKE